MQPPTHADELKMAFRLFTLGTILFLSALFANAAPASGTVGYNYVTKFIQSDVKADAGQIASGTLAKTRGGTGQDNTLVIFPASGTLTVATDWNTIAKIETATGVNIITSGEIDTVAELEALLGAANLLIPTELDTSAKVAAIVTDETGTGLMVFNDSPTLTDPFIDNFSNAQHDHSSIDKGGPISGAAITFGTVQASVIDSDIARDTEVAAAISALSAALVAEINSGVPNGTGATIHWSQLTGVPAGLADGSDDGGGGSGNTLTNSVLLGITSRQDQSDYSVTDLTSDTTITANWTNATYFLVLEDNATVSWADLPVSTSLERELRVTVTNTGSFTLDWPTGVVWRTENTLPATKTTDFLFRWDRTNVVGFMDTAKVERDGIAAGTADHIVINDGSGNLSSEATLGATRFPALTGDVTTPGGSLTTTLADSGVTAGVYGDDSHIPQITVDAKGRVTSVTTNAVSGGGGGGGSSAPEVGVLSQYVLFDDDFVNIDASGKGKQNWGLEVGASGTMTRATTAANPGQVNLNISTTGASRVALWCNVATDTMIFGGGAVTNVIISKVSALSDATDSYTIRMGFLDIRPDAESVDGIYWRYRDTVNSGNWQLVVRNNSSETGSVINTSVAPSTSFQKLMIVVNSAGTEVEGFIDGVSVGTTTSNIPTSAGRETGMGGIGIERESGSTNARTLTVDLFATIIALTSSR